MVILQAALEQSSTKDDAQSLIHHLGAAGHLDFRELLAD